MRSWGVARRTRMRLSLLTFTSSERQRARLAQRVPSAAITKFGYGRDGRGTVKAFVLIKLDRAEQSLSRIEEALEPLDIPISTIETGRQVHWSTAVVVGVPEQRLTDAMLVLELKGFSDVMAFHSEANTDATQRGVAQQ